MVKILDILGAITGEGEATYTMRVSKGDDMIVIDICYETYIQLADFIGVGGEIRISQKEQSPQEMSVEEQAEKQEEVTNPTFSGLFSGLTNKTGQLSNRPKVQYEDPDGLATI